MLTFHYDALDRMSVKIVPERPGLDPVHTRDVHYGYDNLNRVVAKIVPERAGLTAAQTRDVYYDDNNAMGLQTKARFDNLDGEGVTNYYDAFGQRTTVYLNMGGHGRYTSYYHDDAGNLWRLTHPDGANIYYNYDAIGRVSTVLDGPSTSIDDYVIRYWYNGAGNRSGVVRGAGTGGFTTVFYRDPIERPTVIANDLPGAGDNPIELAYNPANQITQRTQTNDSYAWTGAYNVSRGYSVNGLNQYIAAGPASFVYDANGNLTSDGTTSYVYDVENRLVSASNGASLVYDPLGRLVQTSGGAAGTTQFNYDGDKLIAEYNGSGTLLRRYVHGPGADEPVAVYEGAALGLSVRRYPMPDERGSIVGMVNADGSPSAYNSYDSWGIPGAANVGRFQYTGQAWIPELGMYHYKARIYSPTLGRFMQTDPIGYDDQINLYAYVANDPINQTDPDGRQAQAPAAAAGCALTGPACPVGAAVGVVVATGATVCAASETCRGAVGRAVTAIGNGLRSLLPTRSDEGRGTATGTNTRTESRREEQYVVRVQAQGTSLRQQASVPLVSDSPVKASAVHGALAGTVGQLTAREQAALAPAVARAGQWVDRVAAGGGIGPIGSRSFTLPSVAGSQMRVDIEVLRGEVNIVE